MTESMDQYMRAAHEEALLGRSEGGIPIGAVIVRNGEIVGRGHNRRVQLGNPIQLYKILEALTRSKREKNNFTLLLNECG